MRDDTPPIPGHVPDAALEAAATEWFFRRDRGFASGEAHEFARWLAQDPRHAALLAEIEASWTDFGRLGEHAVQHGAQPGRVRPASRSERSRRASILLLRPAWLAAAALVVLAFVFAWQNKRTTDIAPTRIATAAGEGSHLATLPDGSIVQLNAGSIIETRFTSAARTVTLVQGEAHFAVAKNPARPFIVHAGEASVRAVGTAFNVHLKPAAVEVFVTEGRVRVVSPPVLVAAAARPPADSSELGAGQKAVVLLAPSTPAASTIQVISVPPAEVDQTLAWQKRRLEYADAPLAEIVADFNRYNPHQLRIADPALATRRFGATFPVDDYEALLRLLESTFGVRVERGENLTVLRLR